MSILYLRRLFSFAACVGVIATLYYLYIVRLSNTKDLKFRGQSTRRSENNQTKSDEEKRFKEKEDNELRAKPSEVKESLSNTFNNLEPSIISFDDAHWNSCRPLFPEAVLYNRVPKTGSTSMTSFLRKCSKSLQYHFLTDLTEQWSDTSTFQPIINHIRKATTYAKKKKSRTLAISHFFFRKHLNLSTNYTFINLLREPVQRFISNYYYTRSPKRWPIRLKKLKESGHYNVTIEQCVDNQYAGCVWNTMTRFFCGPEPMCGNGNRVVLERAKYNIKHYYASVGLLENVQEFIHVLSKRLPAFVVNSPEQFTRTFVTKGVKKSPISKEVTAKIINANKLDIELYKFVQDLFKEQAQMCGIEMNT